ncbi:uncharacterized protein [Drosophila takahashii]|uniref:uncharacterized protein n=1 Tax=Drosophila takahashii TaxID=29030 RepID=UPI003898E4C2
MDSLPRHKNDDDDDVPGTSKPTQDAKKRRPIPPLDQANWEQVQQEIDLKVTEAMKDFYSIHSKGLLRMERLIQRDLLPKLEANSSGNLREIVELVKRLLQRVENLRPVFKLQLDEGAAKKVQSPPDDAPSPAPTPLLTVSKRPEKIKATTDVIFRNPRCTGQAVSDSESQLPELPKRRRHKKQRKDAAQHQDLQPEDSYIIKERERMQFQVNLVLLKKSLFSLHLNRNNRYWPRAHRASLSKVPKPRPIDPASLYG